MQQEGPIGIFDSGIGGLTVARRLAQAYPSESFLYYGDTLHLPYGDKSEEAIRAYSLAIGRFLEAQGCKALVVACNSASAAAADYLREELSIPVVDVIAPLVADISEKSGLRKLGVIATKATIRADVYARAIHALRPDIEVASLATALLAPLIEEGFINNSISAAVIHKYLSYPDFEDIQALLLACTHYPLVRPEIEAYFEGRVAVYDSIEPVVQALGQILAQQGQASGSSPRQTRFFVSDLTPAFARTAAFFFGSEISLEVQNLNSPLAGTKPA